MAKKKVSKLDLNFGLNKEEKESLDSFLGDYWDREKAEKKVLESGNDKLIRLAKSPRHAAFDVLKRENVKQLTIKFSGGNDSGGSDSAYVIREENGELVKMEIELGKYDLCSILEQPIYDKYHGFAWNGEVNGECVWNVDDGTISLNGTETNCDSKDVQFEL